MLEVLASKLLEQGVLGIVILMEALAIGVLWRRTSDLQDKRVEDVKAISQQSIDAIQSTRTAIQMLTELHKTHR